MFPDAAGAVYISRPTRRRLAKALLVNVTLAALFVVLLVWDVKTTYPFVPVHSNLTDVVRGVFLACVIAPICILLFTAASCLTAYRLLRPGFSVAITPEGIIDNCSLIATGVGLIRWEDIVALNPVSRSIFASDTAVRIRVRDPRVLLARLPWHLLLCRRLLATAFHWADEFYLFLFLIDTYRAGDLVAVIRKEYEARRAVDHHLAALPPARIIV